MAGSLHQDEIVDWALNHLMSTVPRFTPTEDLGKRQQQIDEYIGHSAKRDFVQTMIEELSLRDLNPDAAKTPLDKARAAFFEGRGELGDADG